MINKIKFIDLCSGIGGFRMSFEKNGFDCVFSSEIDKDCQEVYYNNFKERPFGDIKDINIKKLPDFEILLAGFPCQPFSISGKGLGFVDKRGTIFYNICNIIKYKMPEVIVLENVKNLFYHDKGRTFKIIKQSLEDLGYIINYKILNAKDFGVPQNRERIIIVACKKKKFIFTDFIPNNIFLEDILNFNSEKDNYLEEVEYTLINKNYIKKQKSGLVFVGYLNKNIRKNGVRDNTIHLSRVHRQTNRIYSIEGNNPTLSSQETSGRYYIYSPSLNKVRKLTLKECYIIMGFPIDFNISKNKSKAYNQIGNSICIPMLSYIANDIKQQFFKCPE